MQNKEGQHNPNVLLLDATPSEIITRNSFRHQSLNRHQKYQSMYSCAAERRRMRFGRRSRSQRCCLR